MSNIYIQEPLTEGKVLLKTTAGDLDIELWAKETPKASRNFVQLCMEGYYDKTIFHRVVKGFIVQGGDPTGTGTGGKSIYDKTFKDEFHSRLRFNRRGLVAMANAGKHDNGSQFFITLGPATELQDKHTIFGKVVGDTLYNLPRFEEGTIDHDDRPEYPHSIMKTEILNNPFKDIVPRVTEKIVIENEVIPEKKKQGTKNFSLLSFGDEAEEDEEEFITVTQKLPVKGNSAHDIATDSKLSSEEVKVDSDNILEKIKNKLKNTKKKTEKLILDTEMEEENEKKDKDEERLKVQREIQSLKREIRGKRSIPEDTEPQSPPKKPKTDAVTEFMEDNKIYENKKKSLLKKGSSRDKNTMMMLKRLEEKVEAATENGTVSAEDDWLGHKMVFTEEDPVLAKDANTKDDTWYDLTDPRHALNKQRRDKKKSSHK